MAYQPQPGTLADRVCRWFLINPEEELTPSDLASKFEVTNKSSISALLASAVSHQLLERTKSREETVVLTVYKAGPKLKECMGQAAGSVLSSAAALPMLGAAAPSPVSSMPAPDSLFIEADIPMPIYQRGRISRYVDTFSRMEVGHSFKCSTAVAKRMYEAASKWGKDKNRKFSVRRLNDDESRIWRIA